MLVSNFTIIYFFFPETKNLKPEFRMSTLVGSLHQKVKSLVTATDVVEINDCGQHTPIMQTPASLQQVACSMM